MKRSLMNYGRRHRKLMAERSSKTSCLRVVKSSDCQVVEN